MTPTTKTRGARTATEAFARLEPKLFRGLGKTPTEVRIALPWPPSTNNLFTNAGGRRAVSRDYAAWRTEAGWTLQAQRPFKFTGPVTIGIELCPPHARRFDLDNRSKALLDLLVTHSVITDDNADVVREVSVKRVDNAAPCTVVVRPV